MATDGSADGNNPGVREETGDRPRNLHSIIALKLMTVRTHPQRRRIRSRIGRPAEHRATSSEPEAPETPAPQARERAAGGPEDRAAYRCSCGCVFEAPVSTTVGCPHCGGTQAW
jgi:hypothetical protein